MSNDKNSLYWNIQTKYLTHLHPSQMSQMAYLNVLLVMSQISTHLFSYIYFELECGYILQIKMYLYITAVLTYVDSLLNDCFKR